MRPPTPLLLLLVACSSTRSPTSVAIAPVDAGEPPRTDASIAQASARLAIADDPRSGTDERCADAFAAFRTRIHPGDSAAAVRAVLGAPTWIGSDAPVDVLGGQVPVEMTFDDQTVVFMCLPKPDPRTNGLPWSPWVIYARLEGRDHKTFGAFLASGSPKKLIEYALCHVDATGQGMKIERFR